MSSDQIEQSLSSLGLDLKRLLKIQLTVFIATLDEASVRPGTNRQGIVTRPRLLAIRHGCDHLDLTSAA